MEKVIVKRDTYNIVVQKVEQFALSNQVGLYIIKEGADGKHYKAKIEWEEITNYVAVEPAIVESVGMTETSSIEYSILNAIPAPPKTDIEGKLEATQKHLEDMRKLVFENAEPKIEIRES